MCRSFDIDNQYIKYKNIDVNSVIINNMRWHGI